jgi:DNA-binding MarR family transcriptional regulator
MSMVRSRPRAATARSTRLAEGVTRLSWRLRRATQQRLAPLGITHAQARLLRTIASAERPLRMSDLAAGLGIVPRSATGTVVALEAAGLVVRRADEDDRRSVLVLLTDDAEAALAAIDRARAEAADEVFSRLGSAEQRALGVLLERLEDDR